MRKDIAKFLDRIAFFISKIEKRIGKFQGKTRKEIARRNLEVILKRAVSEEEIESVFFYHTLYHLQLIFFPQVSGGENVIFEREEEEKRFYEKLEESGAIVISGHIGFPEALSLRVIRIGMRSIVLVENLKRKSEKVFFENTRKKFGINLTTSLRQIVSEINRGTRGKTFGFLVDRTIPGSKETFMFGERVKITDLPFRISAKYNIPIFWILVKRAAEKKAPPKPSELNWQLKVSAKEIRSFDEMIYFLQESIKENYLEWNPFFIYDFTFRK